MITRLRRDHHMVVKGCKDQGLHGIVGHVMRSILVSTRLYVNILSSEKSYAPMGSCLITVLSRGGETTTRPRQGNHVVARRQSHSREEMTTWSRRRPCDLDDARRPDVLDDLDEASSHNNIVGAHTEPT
ncbi:unnamed protein product [Linum trigynum]|uniref:Uncharacterized protein n=1 Tax=Linum trigynum TaxID=586398 RepID=A0AAV2GMI0_9ROSI